MKRDRCIAITQFGRRCVNDVFLDGYCHTHFIIKKFGTIKKNDKKE